MDTQTTANDPVENCSTDVENNGTEGNLNDQTPVADEVVEATTNLVSVEEALAMFADNPGIACIETHEGRLWREGYFA